MQKLISILFIITFLPLSLFGQIIGIIEEVQGTNTFVQEDQSVAIEEYDDLILGQKFRLLINPKLLYP